MYSTHKQLLLAFALVFAQTRERALENSVELVCKPRVVALDNGHARLHALFKHECKNKIAIVCSGWLVLRCYSLIVSQPPGQVVLVACRIDCKTTGTFVVSRHSYTHTHTHTHTQREKKKSDKDEIEKKKTRAFYKSKKRVEWQTDTPLFFFLGRFSTTHIDPIFFTLLFACAKMAHKRSLSDGKCADAKRITLDICADLDFLISDAETTLAQQESIESAIDKVNQYSTYVQGFITARFGSLFRCERCKKAKPEAEEEIMEEVQDSEDFGEEAEPMEDSEDFGEDSDEPEQPEEEEPEQKEPEEEPEQKEPEEEEPEQKEPEEEPKKKK